MIFFDLTMNNLQQNKAKYEKKNFNATKTKNKSIDFQPNKKKVVVNNHNNNNNNEWPNH